MPFFAKNDRVVINVDKENRDWGYNPAADGTLGTIIGFATIDWGYIHNCGIKPGIYSNTSWPTVRLDNGEELCISNCHIKHQQVGLMEARREAYWKLTDDERDEMRSQERVGDLPETKFWPGDVVKCSNSSKQNDRHPTDTSIFVVCRVDYGQIGQLRNDGSPMPIYNISDKLDGGWYMYSSDEELQLVERGNVWKYYHNEPLWFDSLEEEARFFKLLGRTIELRNPANSMYSWTLEEALAAIRSGTAHAITVGGNLFGSGSHTNVIKYLDDDLGKRIAELTLKGFK